MVMIRKERLRQLGKAPFTSAEHRFNQRRWNVFRDTIQEEMTNAIDEEILDALRAADGHYFTGDDRGNPDPEAADEPFLF